jgi:hypothetical protein
MRRGCGSTVKGTKSRKHGWKPMAKGMNTLNYAGMSTLEAVSLKEYNTQVDSSQDQRDQDETESLIVLQSSHLVGQRPDKVLRMSMVISQRREE